MKKITLALSVMIFVYAWTATAQNQPALKGSGERFFYEDFDWGDPTDPKGWKMPEGYLLIDPDDIGYNFMWMPQDSIIAEFTAEPPFQSTSGANGYLGIPLNWYNNYKEPRLEVNNSIQFPHFDCSQHASVIVRYETHFMNGGPGLQEMRVSVDGGTRWAVYNVGFGVEHKDRPNDAAPGQPVIYEASITDLAAGMSDVIIQLYYGKTTLYFWVLDDFELTEAYDNDLRIKHYTVSWDNEDPENPMSPFIMIPKNQLNGTGGFFNWEASVLNFGEYDQENVYLDLSITKNNQVIWEKKPLANSYLPLLEVDTTRIADKFIPEEFGHYKVTYNFTQKETENTPENNKGEFFFHVNDSVYSRSDDTPDLAWSYLFERYGDIDKTSCEDYFTGSIFPIWKDCEVSSVSTYIMGGLADGQIEFQFQLWLKPSGDDPTPVKILATEMVTLDSSMFNTWVTLPFGQDGETEFLSAGDLVYAGISQWDWHSDYLLRRGKSLKIGTDRTVKMTGATAIGIYDGNVEEGLGSFVGRRNLMCRLNLNDHSNIVDGLDIASSLSSLGQNYPNPFRSSTQFTYELLSGSDVRIEVRDVTGRKVIDRNEGFVPAGTHSLKLDASGLDAGVYFYLLKAGKFSETRQMVIY